MEVRSGMKKLIGLLAGLGTGVALGVMLLRIIDLDAIRLMGPGEFALFYGLLIVMLAIALVLQFALHEAGHLVCGLISGYSFVSWRLGSLMVVRADGRLALKRLSMPGTGGQCLMAPPGVPDGDFPVILYNLGGVIANLLSAAACAALLPVAGEHKMLAAFLGGMAFFGVALAVINGLPLRGAAVPNDGWNALNLGKGGLARRSFWVQLAVNGRLAEGMRMRDMPGEWFELPPETDLGETFAATLAVFAENRLMDEHAFEEAEALCGRLLADGAGTVALHRPLVACDRVFCRLVLGRDGHEEELTEKGIAQYLRMLSDNPSVLRTRYAIELLAHSDREAAQRLREKFDEAARSYPTEADIACERELMAAADELFSSRALAEGVDG